MNKAITEIELKFNTLNLLHKGAHIWPIIHYIIGAKEHKSKNARKNSTHKRKHPLPKILINCIIEIASLLNLLTRKTECDNLYISSKNNLSRFQSGTYDRVVDAFIENDLREGISPIKLAFSLFEASSKPTYTYHFNLTYVTKAIKPLFFLRNTCDPRAKRLREDVNELISSTSHQFNGRVFLSIVSEFDAARFISKLTLKRLNPKNVFTSNCYSLDTTALIHEANKRKITTYNIQHGAQNKLHYAFNFKKPHTNYNTVPTNYIIWDKDSEANIDNFSNPTIKRNPWIDFSTSLRSHATPLHAELGFSKSAIITTQPSLGIINNQLKTIVKECPDIFFYYRLHPSQKEKRNFAAIENELKDCKNFEVRDSTTLDLLTLLRHSDLHITGFSSSAIEASNSNLHTIAYHETAPDYFPDLIKNGDLTYCPKETILRTINEKILKHFNL